jgi:RNA polymerase sigma factor (sigma-70 family)
MHVKNIKQVPLSQTEVQPVSNEEQIASLMEEYGDMVMRLAYTYVKQTQLAEDISQEVFISCYQNLHQFEHKSSYKTWIYRITVNKCKDLLRSWSYKNIYYKDLLSSIFSNGTKSTESSMVESEEKEEIFQKVLSLPVKFREVIILYYYEECSVSEIAELLKISANTVKTRLHRARIALKGFLKEEIEDERKMEVPQP